MKKIINGFVLFGIGILSAQTNHTVPFASSNNVIELYIKNANQSQVVAEVIDSPEWLKFVQKKVILGSGSNNTARFHFSVDKSAIVNQAHKVGIAITNTEGKHWTKEISIEVNVLTTFEVFQNYPNPFNPATSIHFQIPQAGKVVVKVYDILGKEVSTLNDKELEAGGHVTEWHAQSVSSGMYFYRLEYDGKIIVKKMLLMK